MILNYLKIALRVFGRNKLISFINLLGLSLGIAVFAISMFYIDYELNFENFQPHHERIFRVNSSKNFVGTPSALGRLLLRDFPEIESVTRIGRSSWAEKVTVKADNRFFYESKFYFVDSSFFNTFDYQLLYGKREEILKFPNTVVLNEKTAQKYFGVTNALGKFIEFCGKTYQVSGIAENIPPNSHFHFDIISSFRGSRDRMYADLSKYWGSYNYFTYVRFKEHVDENAFHDKLIKYAETEYSEYNRLELFKRLYFQPIKKAHTEMIRGNLEAPVNEKYLMIYMFVAVIILVVASINYINLSIATSIRRAKEIGLRKVVGAYSHKIRSQFLAESVFFTLLSLAFSFVFIETFIPLINKWFGFYIAINYLDYRFILLCLIVVLWVGVLSGSYTAMVVSKLKPIKVLKSGFIGNKVNTRFRNILLVIQFAISVGLIIAAMSVKQQINFIDKKDIGYNRHGVVNLTLHDDKLKSEFGLLKQEMGKIPLVQSLAANSFCITDPPFHQTVYYEKDGQAEQGSAWYTLVGPDFFKTYQIEIIQGRSFYNEQSESSFSEYVINQKAAQHFFGDENPVGQRLSMRSKVMGIVVGVVNDFNFRSLHHPVEPIVFSLDKSGYDYLSIRYVPSQKEACMSAIKNSWMGIYPNYPIELQDVNYEYSKLYQTESQTGSLIIVFTSISIIISCMGLFGVNSLIAKYRVREISIRKVFGASAAQVVVLLSSKITKLVVLGNLIAWPLVYYLIDNWLNNFAYRTHIHWSIFLISFLIILLVALFTVSSQSLKTANTNPAQTLKFE